MTRDDHIRVPPCAIEAEQAVLGGLMLSPQSLVKIADWLTEDDFYRRDHRAIYRAVSHLAGKGEACDPVTMGDWLRTNGIADLVGGTTYIIELANATPSAANIAEYAKIVKEKSQLRQVIDSGTEAASAAFEARMPAAEIAARATQKLGSIGAVANRGGLRPTKPLLKAWFAELCRLYEIGDRVTGLPTPWHDLNQATHGLQDGELILIAARPNMGKSVAGFNLAAFTALRGKRTALFSLEMTATQVMRRCVSSIARVPHDWLMAPNKEGDSELYWPRVSDATAELTAAPLWIDDEAGLTIDQIRARALREHLRDQLRLVVIDHAQIVKRQGRNEVTELGEISRGAKSLAKDLKCPVVMLAQLNRGLEQRPNKRPVMPDLRASGELEQDADLILFMYRDDYYNSETHLKGVVEMEIGKGRDVKTGTRVHLLNRYDEMRLEDWEGAIPQADAATRSGGSRRGFATARPRAGDSE